MANRTNFYKNPSYTYNKQYNLNFALQNLKAYNAITGNTPLQSDEPIVPITGDNSIHQKRRREPKQPPPLQKFDDTENDEPMSHHEYIEKRRKEVNSSKPYEELTEEILASSSSVSKLVPYESDSSSSESEQRFCSESEVKGLKTQFQQRFPFPGEPICVICGKYGEYICNETEEDICSIDCKAELLQKGKKVQEGPRIGEIPIIPFPRKISSLCNYKCWKCDKPGHLPEDCLVMSSSESSNQVAIPKDLLTLYKRAHQIGRNISSTKCNICPSSITLATCIKCSNTFCDSVGHLKKHIMEQPSHQQYYSHKLKRLVKCCKSSCKVTEINNLLACNYCFNKAFDKFYDMYTATWKEAGISIIWNSICCEDHFEWHRINCVSSNIEDSAYIVRACTQNIKQLSDFIF